MKHSSIALVGIALLALGTLVMPQTASLFAGQHWWYNISGVGNQIPCQKCHADVFEELALSNFHTHWGPNGYNLSAQGQADQYDCAACHRSNLSIQYALVNGSVANFQPGKQAHAASVVACMLCHQVTANATNATWAPGFYAGGFNITPFVNAGIIPPSPYKYSNATFNGLYAAHNAFIAMAIKNKTFPDSTEACIACHTHVAVKIIWHHKRSLEFDVNITNPVTLSNGVHNWTISNWAVNGTAVAVSWGNTSGYGNTTYNSSWWPGNVSNIYS